MWFRIQEVWGLRPLNLNSADRSCHRDRGVRKECSVKYLPRNLSVVIDKFELTRQVMVALGIV